MSLSEILGRAVGGQGCVCAWWIVILLLLASSRKETIANHWMLSSSCTPIFTQPTTRRCCRSEWVLNWMRNIKPSYMLER